jgi:hypothetical protein
VGYIYLSRLIALGTVRELSHLPQANPPGTDRLEIHSEAGVELLGWMRQQPGVLEATLFGRSVRAMVEQSARTLLEAHLREHAPDAEVLRTEASLEDVFVTLTANEAAGK